MVYYYTYSQTSLIQTPVIRACTFLNQAADSLYFFADLAEIAGNTVSVACFSLYISEIRTNPSYGHPLIPRRLDIRRFHCIQFHHNAGQICINVH